MQRLTKRKLTAIREALTLRLAGELDDTEIPKRDYNDALKWADEKDKQTLK